MKRYAFWNNKGGTGKTSLAFQAAALYAEEHPGEKILVLDLCPQANLSELLLGGLVGGGSNELEKLQSKEPRQTVGGYFESRLPSPYTAMPFASLWQLKPPGKPPVAAGLSHLGRAVATE